MSFRGGRGGGYGGPGRNFGKPGGPFGIPDLNPEFAPLERYPKTILPVQSRINPSERKAASQFLQFRSEVRDGPLYTGSNPKKGHIIIEVDQSIGDGIRRYTDRYQKKRKIGRSIDEHPYVLEFFPEELHACMGVKDKSNYKPKGIDISKFVSDNDNDMTIANGNARVNNLANTIALMPVEDGEAAEDAPTNNNNSEQEEDEVEDEFEEDDDDDYNAEKYFDDGEGMDEEDDDDEAAY